MIVLQPSSETTRKRLPALLDSNKDTRSCSFRSQLCVRLFRLLEEWSSLSHTFSQELYNKVNRALGLQQFADTLRQAQRAAPVLLRRARRAAPAGKMCLSAKDSLQIFADRRHATRSVFLLTWCARRAAPAVKTTCLAKQHQKTSCTSLAPANLVLQRK